MKQLGNILLSGGGTGGHIYPALAIANELKKQHPEAQFLFVGAKNRMEMEKIPNAGYEIKGLWISGLQRKLTLKNLLFPLKLISSMWKAFWIVKKFKPSIVIGTGGFASGPVVFMAGLMGVKTVIQEQNSYPGITNKLLGKRASKICVAYDGLERFFAKEKIVKTGNPVRQDLLNISTKREEALEYYGLDSSKKTVVVIGGSLGARAINMLVESHLDLFQKNNLQLIWQTGKLYFEEFKKYNKGHVIQTFDFMNRMDLTYAAADIIISRAGASSISELCIVGKPVLFIPSPNVAEDHQTKNALSLVNRDAALMLKESSLELFNSMIQELVDNSELQNNLSKKIKTLAQPDATNDIVKEIEKLTLTT